MGRCRLQDCLYRGQDRATRALTWEPAENNDEDNEEDEKENTAKSWKKKDKIKCFKISKDCEFKSWQDELAITCETMIEDFHECPLTRDFDVDDFVKLEFDERHGKIPKDLIEKVLKQGVLCEVEEQGECLFRFFAFSSSQLRYKMCILVNYDAKWWTSRWLEYDSGRLDCLRRTRRKTQQRRCLICPSLIWNYYGKFAAIKTVPKFGARLGLLLSSTRHAEFIEDGKWMIEEDIRHHGFNFTDGCGRMSTSLAERFTLNKHCARRYCHQPFHVPSIVQIRFMGCKGILVHDPALDSSSYELILRESQKKFDWNFATIKGRLKYTERKHGRTGRLLGICRGGESKPFVYGRLNRQFVLVLSALGIANTTFLEIQNEFFDLVMHSQQNISSAFDLLCLSSKTEEAERLTLENIDCEDDFPPDIKLAVEGIYESIFQRSYSLTSDADAKKAESAAFSIPLRHSRNLYGAADFGQTLRKGECFVQYTDYDEPVLSSGETRRSRRRLIIRSPPNGTRIVVMKSPTYFPGDVRVLTQRRVRSLEHLTDVIVFPTHQSLERPHPHEIHESDLDGDEYFVSWDRRLIPKEVEAPLLPCTRSAPAEKENISKDDLIAFFARYESPLGLVDKNYKVWAEEVGPDSEQCRQLAKIFSEAVDQAKHGGKVEIPAQLRRRTSERGEGGDFLLERDLTDGQLVHAVLLRNLLRQPAKEAARNLLQRLSITPNVKTEKERNFVLVSSAPKTSDYFEMIRGRVFSHPEQPLVQYLIELSRFNRFYDIETLIFFFRPSDSDPTKKSISCVGRLGSKVRHDFLFNPFSFQTSCFIEFDVFSCFDFTPLLPELSLYSSGDNLEQIHGKKLLKAILNASQNSENALFHMARCTDYFSRTGNQKLQKITRQEKQRKKSESQESRTRNLKF